MATLRAWFLLIKIHSGQFQGVASSYEGSKLPVSGRGFFWQRFKMDGFGA